MSLIAMVVEITNRRRVPTTPDDAARRLRKFTRKQVATALRHAKLRGEVALVEVGHGMVAPKYGPVQREGE